LSLTLGGLCSRQAGLQQFDLAIVVGFVFTNVEPLAVIVRGTPSPVLVDGQEPGVVALAEFGQRMLARFFEQIQIVVEAIAFNLFAGRFAEFLATPHFSL